MSPIACTWRIALSLVWAGLMLCGCATPAATSTGDVLRIQREGVLGTSLAMEVVGTPAEARRALQAALEEIARLEGLLSTWRDDSELSAYNAGRIGREALSADVRAVLDACEHWRQATTGAFSCRLGGLIRRWREAQSAGQLPDRGALRRQARAIAALERPLPGKSMVEGVETDVRFDVDGIAKGYILDRALARARAAAPGVSGMRLDIGGDALHWGQAANAPGWDVAIADPAQPLDNGEPVSTVRLQAQAIAASGHSSRGYRIGRRAFSHVLDPQQGWPLSYAPSAVVVADDAATADALATALTVLPIRSGLQLADRLPGVAALIVSDSGIAFASQRWPALLVQKDSMTAALRDPQRIVVDYEIPQLDSQRYRQPYLAIWVEREDGTPLRQLHVLGDRSRWLSELPRWWRHYGRNDPAGVYGLARPTRKPGRYTVAWNGRDDRGHAMPQGAYVLRVEAAREHGGHDHLSIPFALPFGLGAEGVAVQHPGQGEIGRIVIRYERGS